MNHGQQFVTAADADKMLCPISMGSSRGRSTCRGPSCFGWKWGAEVSRRVVRAPVVTAVEEPERLQGMPASWLWRPYDADDPALWVEPDAETAKRQKGTCGMVPE